MAETVTVRWNGIDVAVRLTQVRGAARTTSRGRFGKPPITLTRWKTSDGRTTWRASVTMAPVHVELFVFVDGYGPSAKTALAALEARLHRIEQWLTSVRRAAG